MNRQPYDTQRRRLILSSMAGCIVGVVGGLVGLGGAEFRLPILISAFSFVALEAVILNKAISLAVVASALVFRCSTIPLAAVFAHWEVMLNLLAGSLFGAWFGASMATRLPTKTLYRIIAFLLLLIAVVLFVGHDSTSAVEPIATGATLILLGVLSGFAIGVIAALLGVAGGEFLIPALVLLFGIDVKLAGSLSLAISLPTMLVSFARYSQDRSFAVLSKNRGFVLAMIAGSLVGAYVGAQLLGHLSSSILLPLLALILVFSAWRIFIHGATSQ